MTKYFQNLLLVSLANFLLYCQADKYDPMVCNRNSPEPPNNESYVITAGRLKKIREPLMYPYCDVGQDPQPQGDYQSNITAATPQLQKEFNFNLPFFGFRYNYTRVWLDGYLGFSYPPGGDSYPLFFPLKEEDPSFIGIFLSKCIIGELGDGDVDERTPGVYFRVEENLKEREDQDGVEIRERLKWDLREDVVGADRFEPNHAIIATWKNVSFKGGISQASNITNTFQIVLATDEVYTYVMFNYEQINWTSHTEAGGDSATGQGGIPAFVGFNAGNRTRSYEYKPYSQGHYISELTVRGNSHQGRYYFRIDEEIQTATCGSDVSDLLVAPSSGNMLGGSIVNITGPCFNPNNSIVCKFGSQEVTAVVVDQNRAICIQPPLKVEGYINLKVVLDSSYIYKTKYYSENPATASEKIFFEDYSYNEINPPEVQIRWQRENVSTDANAALHVSLWGYQKTENDSEIVYINDLANDIQNTGSYRIIPSSYKNRNDSREFQFGFILINTTVTINDNRIVPTVWSRPTPLAWYFSPQWEANFGENWTETLCNSWIEDDKKLEDFTTDLSSCPCTLDQALADKGRYRPDINCDKDSNPKCLLHKNAIHCVISGNPSIKGGEQQCCYDKNGYLMLSQDQKSGSSPKRSHHLGQTSKYDPTLSQWYHDVIPRYLCCEWQPEDSDGCRTFRYERRPSDDCVTYEGPGVAGVYGDPHLITFDGLDYTFNGKGEFVLVQSGTDLTIQGRFQQVENNTFGEATRGTKLTGVAAKANSSTVVEVKLRPGEARWRYHLDVLVNSREVYFDREPNRFQHFPGVTVYTPTYILNQSEVVIMFEGGAGIEVKEENGYLSTNIYLPPQYFNKTAGLLGNWTNQVGDDFNLPDGTPIDIPKNLDDMERIYVDFGLHWMVGDKSDYFKGRSLFTRRNGETETDFNDRSFQPEFSMTVEEIIPENRSEYIELAGRYCGPDYNCMYDFALTYDKNTAEDSLRSRGDLLVVKTIAQKKIISCGVLETPKFGRKSTFLFVPGVRVTFECQEGYVLEGDRTRECLESGEWEGEYGYTKCNTL